MNTHYNTNLVPRKKGNMLSTNKCWSNGLPLLSAMLFMFFTIHGGVTVYGRDQQYCQLDRRNTMCLYPEGSGCHKIRRGMDARSINEALEIHNRLRQKVAKGEQNGQPQASNMNELVWNNELAAVAQRWADQCEFRHDDHRNTPGFQYYVGQNLAMVMGSTLPSDPDFTKATDMWYNEVNNFNPSIIRSFSSPGGAGHYTQVVWAEVKAIGCGYSFYNKQGTFHQMYVCNYGPGGNMMGAPIYKIGPPCSSCGGPGCSSKYPGLCAT